MENPARCVGGEEEVEPGRRLVRKTSPPGKTPTFPCVSRAVGHRIGSVGRSGSRPRLRLHSTRLEVVLGFERNRLATVIRNHLALLLALVALVPALGTGTARLAVSEPGWLGAKLEVPRDPIQLASPA